jgi:threonine synthase
MFDLIDYVTKKPVVSDNLVFTGEKNPWEVVIDLETVKSKLNIDYFKSSPPFVSKYLPFLPITDYAEFVSLKEGSTPLIRSRKIGPELGIDLYFKLEFQNPTGSFKDRGSAVDLSIARELKAKAIVLASTGNMAASCACYAAAAQIPCFIFVPEATPTSKLSQAISYGGRIVQVKGTYSDAARLAESVAKDLGFFLAGDYAFRVEGQKTAAFELIDQLFYQTPDYVFIPMGCGTNIAAYAKGFNEYRTLGFIDNIPKLVGIEATGAASIVNSFEKNLKTITPLQSIDTIAGAIAVNDPLDGVKALDGIYQSQGHAVAVTDKDMLEAQYLLSREEGLFVEVASASTLAALKKLQSTVHLKGKKVVLIMTGGGLKDPSSIARITVKPPTIYPEIKDFLALYENAYFEGNVISFVDKNEVVFKNSPSEADLGNKLFGFFNVKYSAKHLARMREIIGKFLTKGKHITFADVQDIVQDAMEVENVVPGGSLEVTDFEVTTGLNRKAFAKVTAKQRHSFSRSRRRRPSGRGAKCTKACL